MYFKIDLKFFIMGTLEMALKVTMQNTLKNAWQAPKFSSIEAPHCLWRFIPPPPDYDTLSPCNAV